MRSLRRQLAVWLLAPLLVLWLINALVTYHTAVESADRAHDRTLYGSVLAIAERVAVIEGELVVDLPYSALEMLESNLQSRVFYRVSHADGRQITGYEDLPRAKGIRESGVPQFQDAEYRGEPVRIVSLMKRVYDESVKDPILIQVAETAELRKLLSERILLESVLQELLIIVLASVLMWLALNRGLRPLNQLRRQVSQRERDDLSPIDKVAVPREVKPLIEAINEHTSRLTQVIGGQKQFIADAAHQLQTPLALLHAQVEYALRQDERKVMRDVMFDVRGNISQMSHLVAQLLVLNRAETETTLRLDTLNLAHLASHTTLEWIPAAIKKSIDLGYEGDEVRSVLGSEALLREVVANLLDNSLKFTPEGGRITVSVAAKAGRTVLTVEDSGAGIPWSEQRRVFDRFYQIPGRDIPGCGLGLSIVQKIARLHRAEVRIESHADQLGTRVEVCFPVQQEPPATPST
jgi:two-component system, OmpR family, sensor histidine kinase TctE